MDERSDDIQSLRRSLRKTQAVAIVSLGMTAALVLMGATRGPGVLRARGLVIVDEKGHDRILLGSPVPVSVDRIRKSAETESLVFLGDNGADRIVVGQAPDPYVDGQASKRIGEGWGTVYFDPKGSERAGMGFLSNGRASVVLDRPNGDGVGMMVDDKSNYAGLLVNYPSQETAFEFAVKGTAPSAELFDSDGRTRAKLKLFGQERPSWEVHDAATAPKATP